MEPSNIPPQQPPPLERKSSGWWWKIPVALIGLLLVLVIIIVLSFDEILRVLVRAKIEQATGHPTQLAEFDLQLRPPGVHIRGFEIQNTPEFGGGVMLSLPELRVTVDRDALAEQKLRLGFVRIDLGEIHMVVNQQGATNFAALRERVEAEQSHQAEARENRPQREQPEFAGVDRFEMSIGTLRFTDLRDPSLNRRVNTGLTNLVVENAINARDLTFKLVGAAVFSGVDVLNLFQGGMENLPRQDEFR